MMRSWSIALCIWVLGVLGPVQMSSAAEGLKTLRIASSTTTDDLARIWAAHWRGGHREQPNPEILSGQLPTDAIEALLAGKADVALVARELFESETAAAQRSTKDGLRCIPIATGSRASRGGTHAIAFFVHESNPIRYLSIPQLRELLARNGHIRTWGELGVEGPLADRAIEVHGQTVRRASGNPPGIVNYLTGRVMAGRDWRTDLTVHEDEVGGPTALAAIVQAVARNPAAIGWSGFDFAVPGAKSVALGSSSAGPFFLGTSAEIAARDYPLSRRVYACLSAAAQPPALQFVQTLLLPAGQAAVSQSASGFLPLPEKVRLDTLTSLQSHLEAPVSAGYAEKSGAIRIVGYNDMREMVAGWTRAFEDRHAGFRFELDLPATRAAIDPVASGHAAVGPLGAELSPSQLARFREVAGVDPLQIRVAHASLNPRALSGPLAIFVHASNRRSEISIPELAAIFGGTSSASSMQPVGLGPQTALGIFFREKVLGDTSFGPSFKPLRQSAEVVKEVAANPQAIGFAAAMRASDGVRALAVSRGGDSPAVALNEANIQSDEYPLGRSLWLLMRPPLDPWLKEFIRFVLSEDGQRIVAEGSLGYQPLLTQDRDHELQKLR